MIFPPSVTLLFCASSAWSYPSSPKSVITELSNSYRSVTKFALDYVKTLLVENRYKYLRILRASLTRFMLKQLVSVFGPGSKVPLQTEQVFSSSSVEDRSGSSPAKSSQSFTPTSFVEALLDSKYSSDKTRHMCADTIEEIGCPSSEEMASLPSFVKSAIDAEAARRSRMYGAEGISESALGNLLEEGVHIPIMMASIEYLSHQALSNENTLSHGDAAGRKVCSFLRNCVKNHLFRGGWE